MDVTRLHKLGWRHTTGLEEGIRRTWERCAIGYLPPPKSWDENPQIEI